MTGWIGREAIAGLMLVAAGCATPGPGSGPVAAYRALGQEPGWSLTIAGGHLDYAGNYGEKRIQLPLPAPRPTPGGYRYETPRLIVEIAHGRCNDAMSGHGYEDNVTVIADGETYRGCGGVRRTEWDV